MNRSLLILILSMTTAAHLQASKIVDFDELTMAGDVFDGFGATAASGSWESQGVKFNTNPFGPGWSYSRVDNDFTPGFGNQYAAFTGRDFSGSGNYVVGTAFGDGGAYFDIPEGLRPQSLRITNTTYAALSMLQGDGFAKKFGGAFGQDPDYLKVTFTGYSEPGGTGSKVGSVEFFLADYRFSDHSLDYVVDRWESVDLSSLGEARSIDFAFKGTDVDPVFGLNTPAYLAIDHLVLTVPEPSSATILASIGVAAWARRRRSIGSNRSAGENVARLF